MDMTMEGGRRTVRVRIRGAVQGVWFRGWTVAQAEELGLEGWVRNRTDGTVEALFSGPTPSVEAMLQRCHRGPDRAVVRDVAVEPVDDGPFDGPFEGFSQRPTC